MKYTKITSVLAGLLVAVPAFALVLTVSANPTTSLVENELLVSGQVITGNTADTSVWLPFEAQVGSAVLFDADANVLDEAPMSVVGEWMTEGPHDFTVTFEFDTPTTEFGTVTFTNEAVGDAVASVSFSVPVLLIEPTAIDAGVSVDTEVTVDTSNDAMMPAKEEMGTEVKVSFWARVTAWIKGLFN